MRENARRENAALSNWQRALRPRPPPPRSPVLASAARKQNDELQKQFHDEKTCGSSGWRPLLFVAADHCCVPLLCVLAASAASAICLAAAESLGPLARAPRRRLGEETRGLAASGEASRLGLFAAVVSGAEVMIATQAPKPVDRACELVRQAERPPPPSAGEEPRGSPHLPSPPHLLRFAEVFPHPSPARPRRALQTSKLLPRSLEEGLFSGLQDRLRLRVEAVHQKAVRACVVVPSPLPALACLLACCCVRTPNEPSAFLSAALERGCGCSWCRALVCGRRCAPCWAAV